MHRSSWIRFWNSSKRAIPKLGWGWTWVYKNILNMGEKRQSTVSWNQALMKKINKIHNNNKRSQSLRYWEKRTSWHKTYQYQSWARSSDSTSRVRIARLWLQRNWRVILWGQVTQSQDKMRETCSRRMRETQVSRWLWRCSRGTSEVNNLIEE